MRQAVIYPAILGRAKKTSIRRIYFLSLSGEEQKKGLTSGETFLGDQLGVRI